eukprot:TRINITY_DN1549_c0_g1_i5.p1 TRINITY_DN1549_c0_g1~~TRINITY_DN1549_c0_g1_i5.p1  ORF type:complete len:886 (+),score=168.81 TRINITY_DN1549_c0_g1_i5:707-3364(+)
MVLLKTSEKSGASFIRTDQLDGETDWKLRRALARTQGLEHGDLASLTASYYIEKPKKDIYNFVGKLNVSSGINTDEIEPITVDNTMWAGTVLATGQAVGIVIYTGRETRSALNRTAPRSKMGLTEIEVNYLSKVLFIMLAALSLLMVALQKFEGLWYINAFRFMILFSAIIPISMRVNLDMAKLLYSFLIMWDKAIPGTLVRNSTLPEELGRIDYLLCDKTGTLTKNDMVFKKIYTATSSYRTEDAEMVTEAMQEALSPKKRVTLKPKKGNNALMLSCVRALALCHNVTPVSAGDHTDYQASSPDEVALVRFAEKVGMILRERDLHSITLQNPQNEREDYQILNVFPFSSSTKRMGIIVRDSTNVITFYMKGADVVMGNIVSPVNAEWMPEQTADTAREGLRTLVFGMRVIAEEEYTNFARRLHAAECLLENREENIRSEIASIEKDLDLLCVTGVEDKLQDRVLDTLERLHDAGIRTWMLTGDKLETAICIALSSKLFTQKKPINTISVKAPEDCERALAACGDSYVVIDGTSLGFCLEYFREQFFRVAKAAPAVVCCRCSPTQKAQIVGLFKEFSNLRTCAIGDGGNDVSMILAADVGLGIEGKEGKQASLAADFSLTQFSHVLRLIVWHGRNSYKRSGILAQFIIHRGLIISFIQAVFSAFFFFAAVAIFQGWLLVGYSTFYTMIPVFSLVIDEDVRDRVAMRFPILYRELRKGRCLSMRTFLQWVFASVFQGGAIMVLSMLLFEDEFLNIEGITFTVLILTELLNIALEIRTWNWLIFVGEVATLAMYLASMFVLPYYFDTKYLLQGQFWLRVVVITAVSCLPVSLTKWAVRTLRPAPHTKVSHYASVRDDDDEESTGSSSGYPTGAKRSWCKCLLPCVNV